MADYSQVIDALNELADFDRKLRFAALTVHNLMHQRIFSKGIAADDRPIGNYSPRYAEYRQSKGRQVSKVDLRFTGKLEGAFVLDQVGTGYASGFINSSEAEKAADNEIRFGSGYAPRDIFMLTEKEEEIFVELLASD